MNDEFSYQAWCRERDAARIICDNLADELAAARAIVSRKEVEFLNAQGKLVAILEREYKMEPTR